MPKSYVGAYWSSRVQSVDDCAERIVDYLGLLASLDSRLDGWGGCARLDYDAALPIDRVDAVVDMLRRGQSTRESDDQIIDKLGYSLNLWNNASGRENKASMAYRGGSSLPHVLNNVVLQLPDSAAAPTLYTPSVALSLITSVVDIFSPDYCVWTNDRLTELQNEPGQVCADGSYYLGQLVGVPAGWAVFLAEGRSRQLDLSLLPGDASVLEVGHGILVRVGDDVAEPVTESVLQVRRAMGYEVHVAAVPSGQTLLSGSARQLPLGQAHPCHNPRGVPRVLHAITRWFRRGRG